MDYDSLTDTQKQWYNALYDESGGDISPDAVVALYPTPTTATP